MEVCTLATYSQGTSPTSIQSPSLFSYIEIYFDLSAYFNALPADDAFFQPELGWSMWGSFGRTWPAGGLGCRLLDRLG